jgi:O2-independent ubiquinone biosynthesis accessory factor UbiT
MASLGGYVSPVALPPIMASLTRSLPLFPLDVVLGALLPRIAARHPGLAARMGEHATRRIVIAPTDLPLAFLLVPDPAAPRVTALRDVSDTRWDARIAGPLLSLVDLARGKLDGDALLFSREIQVEGDIAAILALRNALDAEGIDFVAECAMVCGPLAPFALARLDDLEQLARRALGLFQTGPGHIGEAR